jgi:hypothetical protein
MSTSVGRLHNGGCAQTVGSVGRSSYAAGVHAYRDPFVVSTTTGTVAKSGARTPSPEPDDIFKTLFKNRVESANQEPKMNAIVDSATFFVATDNGLSITGEGGDPLQMDGDVLRIILQAK